jgi:NH3-dependent NAD+ synthetase
VVIYSWRCQTNLDGYATTGNKSETSVGYGTLYGDMAGVFVIKDVPKTLPTGLLSFTTAEGKEIIPKSVIRNPSAELRPNHLM